VAATGLHYGQVSRYFTYNAGSYDVRVVGGGATTCAQSLFDATTLPAFVAGGSATVVGTGLIPPQAGNPSAFTMVAYGDTASAPSGSSKVRFIHDAPTTAALDFGTGTGSGFTGRFTNVAYLAGRQHAVNRRRQWLYDVHCGGRAWQLRDALDRQQHRRGDHHLAGGADPGRDVHVLCHWQSDADASAAAASGVLRHRRGERGVLGVCRHAVRRARSERYVRLARDYCSKQ
jgi:hypothetical protein